MFSNIRSFFSRHFLQHIMLYFLVLLCFSIGITSGVFSVKALSELQKNKLIGYLITSFKSTLLDGQINYTQIFYYSVANNLKTVLILWILSISIIVFPLIFIVIGIRGFVLGFTIGFLIENLGYKGILISIVSILPQNLILIPGLIFFGVISVNYSIAAIKNRKMKKYFKNEKYKMFLRYTLGSIVLCIFLTLGSLVEGYISPILLKGISNYLIN